MPSGRSRERADGRAHDDGMPGGLIQDDVALAAGDRLLAAPEMGELGDEVAHRARGDEEPGLLAEELGGPLLEGIDRRVVAEHVVPDLGRGHGAAHLGRRLRDGVGSEVDQVHAPARIARRDVSLLNPPRIPGVACGDMGRRPEPETIDVDPPREPIRPDEGYRVGARISAGDAGRTRLAGAVAIGIVLAGIAFAAIGPLLPSVPELPIAPVASRPTATPLPDVAVLRPPAPTRLLPVYAGGLRWLDPASGVMSGDPYTAARSGLFVDAEGHGLCVCLEIPWSQDRFVARVTLRRYSATGEEVARATLSELASAEGVISGEPVQVDAAISPDGRRALDRPDASGRKPSWQIGLDRVDLATLRVVASLELDPVPVPPPDDDGVLGHAGRLGHPPQVDRPGEPSDLAGRTSGWPCCSWRSGDPAWIRASSSTRPRGSWWMRGWRRGRSRGRRAAARRQRRFVRQRARPRGRPTATS